MTFQKYEGRMIVLNLSISKLCIEIYISLFIYVIVFEIYTTHLHFINNCHRQEWKNVYETNVYWQEFDVEMSATHRFQVEVDWASIQWMEALCLLLCICLKRRTKEGHWEHRSLWFPVRRRYYVHHVGDKTQINARETSLEWSDTGCVFEKKW